MAKMKYKIATALSMHIFGDVANRRYDLARVEQIMNCSCPRPLADLSPSKFAEYAQDAMLIYCDLQDAQLDELIEERVYERAC